MHDSLTLLQNTYSYVSTMLPITESLYLVCGRLHYLPGCRYLEKVVSQHFRDRKGNLISLKDNCTTSSSKNICISKNKKVYYN